MDMQTSVLMDVIMSGLQSNGQARFRVISNSMLPLIRKDDWVTVSALNPAAAVRFGEIVLFRRQDHFIIHRVIKSSPGQIITKGDNCLSADTGLARAEVLAHVIRLEKGHRIMNLQSRWWRTIHFIMGVISLVIATSRSFAKRILGMRMLRNN